MDLVKPWIDSFLLDEVNPVLDWRNSCNDDEHQRAAFNGRSFEDSDGVLTVAPSRVGQVTQILKFSSRSDSVKATVSDSTTRINVILLPVATYEYRQKNQREIYEQPLGGILQLVDFVIKLSTTGSKANHLILHVKKFRLVGAGGSGHFGNMPRPVEELGSSKTVLAKLSEQRKIEQFKGNDSIPSITRHLDQASKSFELPSVPREDPLFLSQLPNKYLINMRSAKASVKPKEANGSSTRPQGPSQYGLESREHWNGNGASFSNEQLVAILAKKPDTPASPSQTSAEYSNPRMTANAFGGKPHEGLRMEIQSSKPKKASDDEQVQNDGVAWSASQNTQSHSNSTTIAADISLAVETSSPGRESHVDYGSQNISYDTSRQTSSNGIQITDRSYNRTKPSSQRRKSGKISMKDIKIPKEQWALLARPDSWIPAEPGQSEPVAYIPVSILKMLNARAGRKAARQQRSQVFRGHRAEAPETMSNADRHPPSGSISEDSDYSWEQSPAPEASNSHGLPPDSSPASSTPFYADTPVEDLVSNEPRDLRASSLQGKPVNGVSILKNSRVETNGHFELQKLSASASESFSNVSDNMSLEDHGDAQNSGETFVEAVLGSPQIERVDEIFQSLDTQSLDKGSSEFIPDLHNRSMEDSSNTRISFGRSGIQDITPSSSSAQSELEISAPLAMQGFKGLTSSNGEDQHGSGQIASPFTQVNRTPHVNGQGAGMSSPISRPVHSSTELHPTLIPGTSLESYNGVTKSETAQKSTSADARSFDETSMLLDDFNDQMRSDDLHVSMLHDQEFDKQEDSEAGESKRRKSFSLDEEKLVNKRLKILDFLPDNLTQMEDEMVKPAVMADHHRREFLKQWRENQGPQQQSVLCGEPPSDLPQDEPPQQPVRSRSISQLSYTMTKEKGWELNEVRSMGHQSVSAELGVDNKGSQVEQSGSTSSCHHRNVPEMTQDEMSVVYHRDDALGSSQAFETSESREAAVAGTDIPSKIESETSIRNQPKSQYTAGTEPRGAPELYNLHAQSTAGSNGWNRQLSLDCCDTRPTRSLEKFSIYPKAIASASVDKDISPPSFASPRPSNGVSLPKSTQSRNAVFHSSPAWVKSGATTPSMTSFEFVSAVASRNAYNRFKSAYPEYSGTLKHFQRLCSRISRLISNQSVFPRYLWDDFVIRHRLEYAHYVHDCAEQGVDATSYEEYYCSREEGPQFSRNVLRTEDVRGASPSAINSPTQDDSNACSLNSPGADALSDASSTGVDVEHGSENTGAAPNHVRNGSPEIPMSSLLPNSKADIKRDVQNMQEPSIFIDLTLEDELAKPVKGDASYASPDHIFSDVPQGQIPQAGNLENASPYQSSHSQTRLDEAEESLAQNQRDRSRSNTDGNPTCPPSHNLDTKPQQPPASPSGASHATPNLENFQQHYTPSSQGKAPVSDKDSEEKSWHEDPHTPFKLFMRNYRAIQPAKGNSFATQADKDLGKRIRHQWLASRPKKHKPV